MFSNISITICMQYCDYVSSIFWISHHRVRRLPQSVHQILDTSTFGALAVRLEFTENMKLTTTTKYIFLADVANKYKFILLRRDLGIPAGTVSVDGHLLSEIDRGWMEKGGNLVQTMTYLPPSQCRIMVARGPWHILSAGPLRRGLATFAISTGARRETMGAKRQIK